MEVSPDPVTGIFEGSIDITWRIIKKNDSDSIINMRLYLGTSTTDVNILYNRVAKTSLAEKTFGGRIQASLKGAEYTMTLNNLSFSDNLLTFTLLVNTEDTNNNPRKPARESVNISVVRGIHFL